MSDNDSFEAASEPSVTLPDSLKDTDMKGTGFTLKGTGFTMKGTGFTMKGTGFSPYINVPNEAGALAPEENTASDSYAGAPAPDFGTWDSTTPSSAPTDLFQSFQPIKIAPPSRIPHLGHLALEGAFLLVGALCMTILLFLAMHFHFEGVTNEEQVKTNVHYLLGSEAILYFIAFVLSLAIFPLFWKKSLFAGLHWRGDVALLLGWRLPLISVGCFLLAALDEALLPGPTKAPIEEIFRSPGAAWLMFGFGVTIAPFFEEMFFRGFLLPALATSWDWAIERSTGKPAPSLDADGHPQWSTFAMILASIVTSLPFALMHGEQTGHSIGPFFLLVTVSLILCAVRLKTRSLAASTVVHASYNFFIFFLMMIGTDGFRHLDKM